MFLRVSLLLYAILSATIVTAVSSRAHRVISRQTTSPSAVCSQDSSMVIEKLVEALSTTRSLKAQLTDPNSTADFTQLDDALGQVEDGISAIESDVSSENPIQKDTRDQVNENLAKAFDIAADLKSTDPAILANLKKLEGELKASEDSGDAATEDCQPTV
ncbi:hypothetical protein EIP91_005137 [Steccherinum ochraceum]|uniref:Uncharacterized protein n=1 Tax=Steccherinum ochraceum TaxID=92696 RepID=A0A4V2MVS0_9APHY|nr:hypothetical protein EIP91_005137 [Steccherinum ochraceum]